MRAGLIPDHAREANHPEKNKTENHRCWNTSANHGAIAEMGRDQSIWANRVDNSFEPFLTIACGQRPPRTYSSVEVEAHWWPGTLIGRTMARLKPTWGQTAPRFLNRSLGPRRAARALSRRFTADVMDGRSRNSHSIWQAVEIPIRLDDGSKHAAGCLGIRPP